FAQARLRDRVAQRDVGVGRRVAHEAAQLAVELRLEVDPGHARDLAAQAAVGEGLVEGDAAAAFVQRRGDRGQVVADARDDAGTCDHDPARTHRQAHASPSRWNRPTRRSRAVYISWPSQSMRASPIAMISLRLIRRLMSTSYRTSFAV